MQRRWSESAMFDRAEAARFAQGPHPLRDLYQRQVNRERAAALDHTADIDRTGQVGDDRIDQRQSEAGAVADLLGGEEWLEYAGERRFVHAASAVLDAQSDVAARTERAVRK